jgi:hypothetical protein
MCNCPIETKFDNNDEFLRTDILEMFCDREKFEDEESSFSKEETKEYKHKCYIEVAILYCPECEMENIKLLHISNQK